MRKFKEEKIFDENGKYLCTIKTISNSSRKKLIRFIPPPKKGSVHIDSPMYPNKIVYIDEFGNIESEEDMRPEYVQNKLKLEKLKKEIIEIEKESLIDLWENLKKEIDNMFKIS